MRGGELADSLGAEGIEATSIPRGTSATDALLRGLVQHVLSPVAPPAIYPLLDCFQALGDKTLYDR